MSKINNIFCAGTMRTGGSLVSNLLSTHKDLLILIDIVHFFRYLYEKYHPINSKANLYRISSELSLRLKLRDNIKISSQLFYNEMCKNKVSTYGQVYSSIFKVILSKVPEKKIIGEYANAEWKSIGKFLEFNKNNVAIHVIRDPRGMLSSWKKITFSKGHKYFNSIFNWIDSVDCYLEYQKKYNAKKYLMVKFEDIHNNPEKMTKKLCKFLNIKFNKEMINGKKWKHLLKNNFNFINETAYGKRKKVYGFAKERINNWKKHLEDWEINLINHLCKKRLKKLGYETSKVDKGLLRKGLIILKKDKFLNRELKYFLKNNKGNKKSLNDPTDPKNWESRIKPGTKFIKSPEYKIYKKELKEIKNSSKLIRGFH